MTWLNAGVLILSILSGLGAAGVFISTGIQRGRINTLREDLEHERGVSTALREEIADERRRREAADEKIRHCEVQQESMQREIVALGKVITAEAHIVALQEQVDEMRRLLNRVLDRPEVRKT